jgi:hypothetical protein
VHVKDIRVRPGRSFAQISRCAFGGHRRSDKEGFLIPTGSQIRPRPERPFT